MDRGLCSRRVAGLAVLAAALVVSALPQAAGARALGFSLTPSTTEPYAACGRATARHAACLAILVPSRQAGPTQAIRPYSGSGVGGGYAPADLRSAYNLPSASAGSGQTVAIVDAYDDPNAESDLAKYRSRYGLSACTAGNGCFRKVNQAGGTSYPAPEAGWAVEISLDLDMVSAACPNCHILLVEASSNSYNDLFTAENEAVALGATEISNSWAGEEFSGETSFDSYVHHPGVPITASAGDFGYGVEYPAASPYVIAVGGTSLTQASNSRGWSETAWSGTGSGCSAYEPKPAWQTDTGCARRTNTDVAAVADPATPVSVADSYKLPAEFSKPEPGWTLVGGTSASSPLIAGIMALSNAHTRSLTGASALYREAAQNGTGFLDDVVSGSNGSCGSYLCNAGPGYDGPTGLGSPYGAPVAQTEPQWFLERGKLGENGTPNPVPTISWGTLTLSNKVGAPPLKCRDILLGDAENPGGGAAGIGQTEIFAPYDCEAVGSSCAGEYDGIGEHLPWPGKLFDGTGLGGAGKGIRFEAKEILFTFYCTAKASGPYPTKEQRKPTAGDEDDPEVLGPKVECGAGTGIWTPLTVNGTPGNGNWSRAAFDSASGSLTCTFIGSSTISETLSTMNYETGEVLETFDA